MSGKQAKRLRKEQREAGIEPPLDAKRRERAEKAKQIEERLAQSERFKAEYPEEYEAQRRLLALRMRAIASALGSMGVVIR